MNHEEQQYLNLIKHIFSNGTKELSRNGNVISTFGNMMRFSLKEGQIPLLTTKKVAWKTCFKELFWFIKGSTSNHELKKQNVHIWDANGSREFLDSRNLSYNEDDLGPVYGHQWRHFNANYSDCHENYKGKGIDQLENVISMLKDPTQRNSRRMIVSAWNPCQLDEMALPPCHVLVQFNVIENKLSCALTQRSCDIGLGVPFNILSYSILTRLIAEHCGLEADEFVYFMGNVHIYDDHIESLRRQVKNDILPFPKLKLKSKHENIDDYTLDDFELINYVHNERIHMLWIQQEESPFARSPSRSRCFLRSHGISVPDIRFWHYPVFDRDHSIRLRSPQSLKRWSKGFLPKRICRFRTSQSAHGALNILSLESHWKVDPESLKSCFPNQRCLLQISGPDPVPVPCALREELSPPTFERPPPRTQRPFGFFCLSPNGRVQSSQRDPGIDAVDRVFPTNHLASRSR